MGGTEHDEGLGMCQPYVVDGFLGQKFSKKGRFWQIFLKNRWVFQKLAKDVKNG